MDSTPLERLTPKEEEGTLIQTLEDVDPVARYSETLEKKS